MHGAPHRPAAARAHPAAATGRLASERTRLLAIVAFIAALHALGFALLAVYAPAHAGLVGTALLAYTLGLRHAFDADHIAAIDNTTRKLRQQGRRSMGVGFFFSLGHSGVVLVLTFVVALATHAVPDISGSTGFVGASVSGTFLWLVGLANLAVLADVLRVVARMRRGACEEHELEEMLAPQGLLTRLGLGRVMRLVSRSWQMLPIGFLFGLGFDTATEVLLLTLGAGAAASGMPLLAILMLPVLFAAGMSMMDTLDGVLMSHAYDWALRRPARKLYYNLTITSLSVAVALTVGTVQLLHVAIAVLDLSGGFWDWVGGLDFQLLGYATAGLFLATWLLSLLLWRVLRIEQRWAPAEAGGVARAP